jgi:hypothetical protein
VPSATRPTKKPEFRAVASTEEAPPEQAEIVAKIPVKTVARKRIFILCLSLTKIHLERERTPNPFSVKALATCTGFICLDRQSM